MNQAFQTFLNFHKDAEINYAGDNAIQNIAHAVLFLLENDYVTGQVIYEDGGEHLHG